MKKFVTRIAAVEDASELARLNALFNSIHLPPEHYAARIADPDCTDTPLVAATGDEVIGMANLRILKPAFFKEPYAELTELFVEESHRNSGIGRALIILAEHLASEAGAKEIFILTNFYNHAALELYRSIGYHHHDIALRKDLGELSTDGRKN